MTNKPLLLGYAAEPKELKNLDPGQNEYFDYIHVLIDHGILDSLFHVSTFVRKTTSETTLVGS